MDIIYLLCDILYNYYLFLILTKTQYGACTHPMNMKHPNSLGHDRFPLDCYTPSRITHHTHIQLLFTVEPFHGTHCRRQWFYKLIKPASRFE